MSGQGEETDPPGSVKELMEPVLELARQRAGMSQAEREKLEKEVDEDWKRGPRELQDLKDHFRPRRWMEEAGVGELHIRHLCDRPPIECDALKGVREFLADADKRILVLSGGPGTRKTGSACWMLGERKGMYLKARYLLDVAFDDKPRFRQLQRARHVVLDDLKTESHDPGGVWLKTFNGLFDDWYEDCDKLVLTGNFGELGTDRRTLRVRPFDEFRELYGPRVVDRLWEAGRFLIIGGESVRRPPKPAASEVTT